MKYKIVFIILSLFFLSGCEVTYNLDISSKTLKEKTSIVETNIDRFDNDEMATYYYNLYFKLPLALFIDDNIMNPEGDDLDFSKVDGIEYYNISKPSSGVGFIYDGTFPLEDYEDSTIANYAAPFMKYEINDKKISLNSKTLKMIFEQAPTLDKVKINIKVSDYRVLKNNADEKNGNIYVWNITRNQAGKKTVILELGNSDFGNIITNDVIKIAKSSSNVIYIVIFGAIIVIATLFVLNYMGKKNDEINRL